MYVSVDAALPMQGGIHFFLVRTAVLNTALASRISSPPPGVELDSGTAFLSAEPGLIFSSLTSRCRSGLIP